jgi:type I restriction enzyme R subunit
MNNFDYLKKVPQFQSFADVAVAAENLINVDVKACITNSRLALETAIKWMYSIDEELVVPYQETLESLMHTEEFKAIVEDDLWKRLEFIRRVSSTVNNTAKKVTFDQAELCLENLFIFFDFLSCCYSVDYEEREVNPELLKDGSS